MFLISIYQDDEHMLDTSGVTVTINGHPQILKRDGDYLTYKGYRCKILSVTSENGLLSFVCASHAAESEPHVIVGLSGDNGEGTEHELSDEQCRRQEDVEDAIWALLQELAGKKVEWDVSLFAAVRDVISQEFDTRGIMSEMEFYPFIEY
ncbi:MAG TPA: hypothetical protein VHC22_32375 [Pirellulales bacterium]|nr:hypothetical protein [Pirellulales bacterium]